MNKIIDYIMLFWYNFGKLKILRRDLNKIILQKEANE